MDDELTSDLRRTLEATSEGVDSAHGVPHPDRADLDRRIRRRARRRTTIAASLGAVLLVAGAVGGAAIASGADDDPVPLEARGAPSTPTTAPGVSVPDDPELPVVAPDLRYSAQRSAEMTTWNAPSAQSLDATAPGGWAATDHPSTTIFGRTTPDGTYLDVRANRFSDATPGWCAPSGELYVGVRSMAAVGQVRGLRYGEVRAGSIMATGAVVGAAEGEARWVLVAQVAPAATDVRITFPDGHRDHLAPVGGVVVLTARVADDFDLDAIGPGLGDVHIEAADSRGATVAEVTPGDPSCQPPG